MAKGTTINIDPVLALPRHELADAMALKAIANGTANEEQQRRFFGWLVKDACMIGGVSHTSGSATDTAFKEGRRFVGICLTALLAESVKSLNARLNPNKRTGGQENG